MNEKNESLSRRDVLKVLACLPVSLASKKNLSGYHTNKNSGKFSLPNVLIVVLDTLSAQHMSLYGYCRETTPNITRFAEQATVYHRHYATGNFTTPGTGSLLTSTYPWTHRGLHGSGTLLEPYGNKNLFSLFASDCHVVTYTHNALVVFLLAQMQAGIDTLIPMHNLALQENTVSGKLPLDNYAIGDWSETLIRGRGQIPSSLFLSLFEPFLVHNRISSKEVIKRFPYGIPLANQDARYFLLEDVIDWIIRSEGSLPQPYLGYFHLMPPHEPYCPRREFVGAFEDNWLPPQKQHHFFSESISFDQLIEWRQYYDEYLAYADAEFGRLIEGLKRGGRLEDTYLILTSDHGQLFERGIHGHMTPVMYEPLLHIPLVISSPNQRKRQDVYSLTSAVDILPSLLNIMGKPIPDWCEGELLPRLGGKDSPDRQVFALEAKESSKWEYLRKGTVAMLKGCYKLIHYFGYPGHDNIDELYNLEDNPEEMNNQADTHPTLVAEFKQSIKEKMVQAKAWPFQLTHE